MTDFQTESIDPRGRTGELEALGLSSDRKENANPKEEAEALKPVLESSANYGHSVSPNY